MDNEIVLFLQERVPKPVLHAALADLFGMASDGGVTVLVVDYPQGFATGVSSPRTDNMPVHGAVRKLAARLETAVLLESCNRADEASRWLVFIPGAPRPQPVQIVELRHGLDVVERIPVKRRPVRLAYA